MHKLPSIIGLAGKKGSGKTSVANELRRYNVMVMGFADPLYEAISVMFGVPQGTLQDRLFKEQNMESLCGRSPRYLLQTLGTEWGRDCVHPDVWAQIGISRAKAIVERGRTAVIHDVRFDNEADAIRAMGGEIWRVRRDVADTTDTHRSEAGVSDDRITIEFPNNGSLFHLSLTVEDYVNARNAYAS